MEQLYIDVDKLLEDNNNDTDVEIQVSLDEKETFGQDNVPFPLRALLNMYMRSYPICYTDYHKGLKVLIKWLQPIIYNDLTSYRRLPEQLRNWELSELAKIIGCREETLFYTILSIHREGK